MVNAKYNFWNPTDLCQMTAWKFTGGYIAPKKTKQVEAKKIQKVKLTYWQSLFINSDKKARLWHTVEKQ